MSKENPSVAEVAEIICNVEQKNIEFPAYIRELELLANLATRRVEIARQVAEICKSTKTRKPRKDRGTRRTPKAAQEAAKKEFAETGIDTDSKEV